MYPVPMFPGGPAVSVRRRSVTPLWIALVVVALLVGAVAGGGTVLLVKSASKRAADAGATTPVPSATGPTAPAFTGTLRSLLVPAPASAQSVHSYSLTELGIAEQDSDPTAIRHLFSYNGFEDGVEGVWTDGGISVDVGVYQFTSAAGASAFRYYVEESIANNRDYEGHGTVGSLDESALLVTPKPDSTSKQYFGTALVARGSYYAWIDFQSSKQIDFRALSDLAQSQYDRRPKV
jgi:hypothetical protein